MEDLQINHSIRIHSILSIIVVKDSLNAQLPNVMDFRFGRSNHSNIQYHIISYLESQMNYNRNCFYRFEYILVLVDSSIQSLLQNR